MEIKQLQVGYNDAQDRMVLRINIDGDKFANLVLTRRVCRFLLDQIGPFLTIPKAPLPQGLAGSELSTEISASTDANADRRKPRKSRTTSKVIGNQPEPEPASATGEPKADYQTPFEERSPEGNLFGVDAPPPLVVNAGCQATDPNLVLTLHFENQQTMTLTLSQHLAKGIYRLMFDLAERIQWFSGIAGLVTQRDDAEEVPAIMINSGSVTYH